MPVKLSPSRGAGVFTNRQRELPPRRISMRGFICRESVHERIPGIMQLCVK